MAEATARAYLARTGGGSDKHPRVLVRLFRAVASVTATCIPSPTSCGIGCIIPPEQPARRRGGAAASGYWAETDPRSHETHAHIAASGRAAVGAGVTGVLTAVAGSPREKRGESRQRRGARFRSRVYKYRTAPLSRPTARRVRGFRFRS